MRATYRATGRNVLDLLRSFHREPADVLQNVEFEGIEHLEAARARGRGVVALSAHLGCWEIMGAALAARGYPVHVLVRRLFDSRSDALLNAWRGRCGLTLHDGRGGVIPVIRALREGALLGALVDQDTRGPAVFAEFFGRPARTSSLPFLLARRTGAPMVPMWIHRDARGGHRVRIRPELPPSTLSDPGAAIRADAAAWNRLLEGVIRRHPEEWVWHHRRWKTPPAAPSSAPSDFRTFPRRSRQLITFQSSRRTVSAR